MKSYPALDIRTADPSLLYALLDDFAPTAVEEREDGIRAFFAAAAVRDAALGAVAPRFDASAIDVPDEDWARRSQETLNPIAVGRIAVAPPWSRLDPPPAPLVIVIQPSMGFGTGHHATTRLCLEALQTLELRGKTVLDVGTGSGVLAMAAVRLGASQAIGIDVDPDAVDSARHSLTLNPSIHGVTFRVADATTAALPPSDVVTANLTGALLERAAAVLLGLTRAGGALVLSGLQTAERDEVREAFERSGRAVWERAEDDWVGLVIHKF